MHQPIADSIISGHPKAADCVPLGLLNWMVYNRQQVSKPVYMSVSGYGSRMCWWTNVLLGGGVKKERMHITC